MTQAKQAQKLIEYALERLKADNIYLSEYNALMLLDAALQVKIKEEENE